MSNLTTNQIPYFKFVLSYRGNEICERIFKASWYNKDVRNSVNIKPIVPDIRKNLQKILSTPSNKLTFKYYVGKDNDDKEVYYNLNTLIKKESNFRFSYQANKNKENGFLIKNLNKDILEKSVGSKKRKYSYCVVLKSGRIVYIPSTEVVFEVDGVANKDTLYHYEDIKVIDIAEELTFKFALFINNNFIIEREFTVYSYNPEASYSIEFMNAIEDIINDIKKLVYKADVIYQNEEYEISLKHYIPYTDVQKLTMEEKQRLLRTEPNFENYKFED